MQAPRQSPTYWDCSGCGYRIPNQTTCSLHAIDSMCDNCSSRKNELHPSSLDCLFHLQHAYKCQTCNTDVPYVTTESVLDKYSCYSCIFNKVGYRYKAENWHKFIKSIPPEFRLQIYYHEQHKQVIQRMNQLEETVKELKDALLYQTGSTIVNELKEEFESKTKKQKVVEENNEKGTGGLD